MASNNFLPFCGTDTGTNLLTQGDYAADPQRDIGNQPGIAKSRLVNKAIRQSAFITSQVAQYMANKTGADVLDDANTTKLLALLNATLMPMAPTVTQYLTGTGTHNKSYIFFTTSCTAAAGDTYTSGGVTYTVLEAVTAGLTLRASGNAAPAASGTLVRATGAGTASITFYAMRVPVYFDTRMIGSGGGGSGGGSSGGGNGSNGGDTTFGANTAGGGIAGAYRTTPDYGGNGGTPTVGLGVAVVSIHGGDGGSSMLSNPWGVGGSGGAGPFGGSGLGGFGGSNVGKTGATNSGAGGGGGGTTGAQITGTGGGAGAYIESIITAPAATYSYAVGAGGAGGTAGASGQGGGTGADGQIIVIEHFQ